VFVYFQIPKHPEYCEFIEEYSPDKKHMTYRTAVRNRNWYLGFKKNGKPIKGKPTSPFAKRSKRENCYAFMKFPMPARLCRPRPGDGPNVNMCNVSFRNRFPGTERRRIRHPRSHKDHRNSQNG